MSQLGRVFLDRGRDIDDASRGSVSGEFDWFSGVLVADVETEPSPNVLDGGEARASAGVEDDVEEFETGRLEPSPSGGESSDGGGV